MAGDWIKMRKKLLTDPRVVQISSRIQRDRFSVIGALMTMWCIADDHGEDMPGVTVEALSTLVGMPGFAEALPPDWLEATASGIRFPSYSEHNGTTAKKRALDASRQRQKRVRETSAKRHAGSVTREEKRRELTTPPTEAPKSPEVTNPAHADEPPVEPPDSETALPETEKPVTKPKSVDAVWMDDRYRELLALVPDITHAKGRPLISTLVKQTTRATVEQVFAEMRRRGDIVALAKIYPVFQQRCKQAYQAPPVSRGHAGDREVSDSFKQDWSAIPGGKS